MSVGMPPGHDSKISRRGEKFLNPLSSGFISHRPHDLFEV